MGSSSASAEWKLVKTTVSPTTRVSNGSVTRTQKRFVSDDGKGSLSRTTRTVVYDTPQGSLPYRVLEVETDRYFHPEARSPWRMSRFVWAKTSPRSTKEANLANTVVFNDGVVKKETETFRPGDARRTKRGSPIHASGERASSTRRPDGSMELSRSGRIATLHPGVVKWPRFTVGSSHRQCRLKIDATGRITELNESYGSVVPHGKVKQGPWLGRQRVYQLRDGAYVLTLDSLIVNERGKRSELHADPADYGITLSDELPLELRTSGGFVNQRALLHL
jgi:hypothetical protein